ncbi:MAG: PaaI family thioesterase [Anaerovoracaceae bacterium]|jgi:acyl-CoA thioesterase
MEEKSQREAAAAEESRMREQNGEEPIGGEQPGEAADPQTAADNLRRAREYFGHDLFATATTGVVIEAAARNYARCSLRLGPQHKNALQMPMGGALYTLADFVFAIASNFDNVPTVTMVSEIRFLTVAGGDQLTAESVYLGEEGRDCRYRIDITDAPGHTVAEVRMRGRRRRTEKEAK